jgi:hypothetical protein
MLKAIPTKTVTSVETEITSIIQYYSDDFSNIAAEIANALQVRCARDQTYFLVRRNSSDDWHKFTSKALALLIQRASQNGNTGGLTYPEASRLVNNLIRIAPVAINVHRRMAPSVGRHN